MTERHVHALDDIRLDTPSIVTIGVFDGVHLGHQRLIQRLVREAHASGRTSVIQTFFPHPDAVLKGVTGRYYLTSPEERAELLLALGVDWVVTLPFNDAVRQVRAADYVDQLCRSLKMNALWVGPDFALGYKREGDVAFLRAQGEQRGFTVDTVDLRLDVGGQVIRSSLIREILQAGQVEQAAEWLGRPYAISGEIVHGDHRGRLNGYPTANLDVWPEKLLPANGVYACWAYVQGTRYMAVTNFGIRPTFAGTRLMIEAHLLDFAGDLYGQTLLLELVRRLREEKRFDGIDALVVQIGRDVAAGRTILTELAAGSGDDAAAT
ncbi:MAG: bifunctional riboflavin kinase/FAD synthetase [Anaerolineae bacterium]|nr:bifunctional riboflavin kinase/FAD synthetase [Anaerolineae bacterium]